MRKLFQVYHLRNSLFAVGDEVPEFNERNYMLVAAVAASHIEDVYMLTNHIDRPWPQNEGVLLINPSSSPRSTSVGDVIIEENGVRNICDIVGWKVF